jgi:hypothetical protein
MVAQARKAIQDAQPRIPAVPAVPGQSTNCSGQSGLLLIYSAVMDQTGRVYLGISPYNRFEGALIVQFDSEANREIAIRCPLPKDDRRGDVVTPAYIAPLRGGIALASATGDLWTYRF